MDVVTKEWAGFIRELREFPRRLKTVETVGCRWRAVVTGLKPRC
jgi:hypothetical protein